MQTPRVRGSSPAPQPCPATALLPGSPRSSPTKPGALSPPKLCPPPAQKGLQLLPLPSPTWPPSLRFRENSLAHCSLKQGWKGKGGWGQGLTVLEQGGRTVFGESTRGQVNRKRILPSSEWGMITVSILKCPGRRLKKGRPRIFSTIMTVPVVPVNSPLEVRLEGLNLMMAPLPPPISDKHTHGHTHAPHTDACARALQAHPCIDTCTQL